MSENLRDLYKSKELQDGWVICKNADGSDLGNKSPIVVCKDCESVMTCGSFAHFRDMLDVMIETAEEQDNKHLITAVSEFAEKVKDLGLCGDDEPTTDNDGNEKETTPPSEKKSTKKKKKPAAKKKAKQKKNDDSGSTAKTPEDSQPQPVEIPQDELPHKFVVIPKAIDKTGIKSNLVKESDLEPLLMKMEEEQVEYTVHKVGPDLRSKAKAYDYLVLPSTKGEPMMVSKDDLMAIVTEHANSDIDLQIFELGKEYKYKKKIILTEVED